MELVKQCRFCSAKGSIENDVFRSVKDGNTCRKCCNLLQRKWKQRDPDRINRLYIIGTWRLKMAFLVRYGKVCKCCGERDPWLLTIDHINGRIPGFHASHTRKELLRLKRCNWSDQTVQILCFNCNISKGIYGTCPHQLR